MPVTRSPSVDGRFLNYQWYKTVKLLGAIVKNIPYPNLTDQDAGEYEIQVSNAYATSRQAV